MTDTEIQELGYESVPVDKSSMIYGDTVLILKNKTETVHVVQSNSHGLCYGFISGKGSHLQYVDMEILKIVSSKLFDMKPHSCDNLKEI